MTFCPLLWNTIWIEHNGDVSPCCLAKFKRHFVPVLGNVYQQPLTKIYNNKIIQNLRQTSLNNCLGCYKTCHLFSKNKKNTNELIDVPQYTNITLRINTFCNINCIMCNNHSSNLQVGIDFERMKDNLCLNLFNDIQLTGGEPLAIPISEEIFDYIIALNKQVSIMTNGLLLSKWAERLGRWGKRIYISINAVSEKTHELVNRGSNLKTVMAGVEKIKEYYNKYKNIRPNNLILHAHMCVVKENIHELPLFIKNPFGFDEIGYHFTENVKNKENK